MSIHLLINEPILDVWTAWPCDQVIVPIRNIGKLVECVGPSQPPLDSFLLEDTKYSALSIEGLGSCTTESRSGAFFMDKTTSIRSRLTLPNVHIGGVYISIGYMDGTCLGIVTCHDAKFLFYGVVR